jgi:hypothetical protein
LGQLALDCGLTRRRPRKIGPLNFLYSCLLAVGSGACCLRRQALLAGLFVGQSISKQALYKRLGEASTRFMAGVLARLLSAKIAPRGLAGCAGSFRRILVQDSTCLALPPSHLDQFPGPANGRVRAACARIQCIMELLSERFLAFSISPFTRNDQAASADLLDLLRPGDLVLRDLGYFSIGVLERIAQAGAFFLSRWQYNSCLLEPATAQPVELLRVLDPHRPSDIPLLLGKEHKMPVRLLAFPLPQQIAEARRRKARKNRDRRARHSKTYFALLSWNIFLTGCDARTLPLQQACQIYGLRWRVEILFKSWKRHMGLSHLCGVGPRQIQTLICAGLILAVMLHDALPVADGRFSILKLAELFADFLLPILLASAGPPRLLHALGTQLSRHCAYETRKRPNFHQRKARCLS